MNIREIKSNKVIVCHCYVWVCSLCPALKAVFENGLKKSSLLGTPGHPWLFIEEVSRLYQIFHLGGGVCLFVHVVRLNLVLLLSCGC